MKEELKKKLLKLYELSKRGEGGEKVNAEMFLNKLLAKHNLTIDDIDSEIPKKRYYEYTTKANESLITQIIVKVLNKNEVYSIDGLKEVMGKLTDYQHVQVLELIDYHIEKFNKEKKAFLDDFRSAYIQKHRLFRESNEDAEERTPPTPEEIADIMRVGSIQGLMNNDTYTRKIEIKNN